MRRSGTFASHLALLLMAGGWTSAARANEFEQAWTCVLQPGHTLDDARAVAASWLRAARSMRGGESIGLVLRWPIVVADSAQQFEFVLRAPSLAAWGAFYDLYDPSSPVGKADEEFARIADCAGSTLWETIRVEP